MKKTDVVAALAALAQENRLDVFRLLIEAGHEGLPAGAVVTALDLAPNTLTFRFDRLRAAGLVTVRRDGRSMIYAAQYETMNSLLGYLTDSCCGGASCAPAVECKRTRKRTSCAKSEKSRIDDPAGSHGKRSDDWREHHLW